MHWTPEPSNGGSHNGKDQEKCHPGKVYQSAGNRCVLHFDPLGSLWIPDGFFRFRRVGRRCPVAQRFDSGTGPAPDRKKGTKDIGRFAGLHVSTNPHLFFLSDDFRSGLGIAVLASHKPDEKRKPLKAAFLYIPFLNERQWLINTGTVMWFNMWRVTPPNTNSRQRAWP